MKREKVVIPRRFWYWRISLLLLVLHVAIFAFIWVAAMTHTSALASLGELTPALISVHQSQIAFALLWIPFLLIHVGAHLYFAGRSDGGATERQVYREGFRDGARHSSEDGYDTRRLMLDEDGELVELPLENKQKRSYEDERG